MNKKRVLGYYELYKKSKNRNLYDCYKKPSQRKIEAMRCITVFDYIPNDGYNIKVITYNSSYFTVGYMFDRVDYFDKKKRIYFRVITPNHATALLVEESEI